MNKNLVVLRCGRNSLHNKWVTPGIRTWDLVLCPYEEIEDTRFPLYPMIGDEWKNLHKFSGLSKYFTENNEWRNYDFVWLPDDDIATDCEAINRFFELCRQRHTNLAAPSLSEQSYFSHPITMVNKSFQWRKTTFVEIMIPCFHRDFLETAVKTFTLSRSGTGFGLEYLWSHLLKHQEIYIFDSVSVTHTRPVGAFRNEKLKQLADSDLQLIVHGLGAPTIFKTYEASTHNGTIIKSDMSTFLIDYLVGFRYLVEKHDWVLAPLIENQKSNIPDKPPSEVWKIIEFIDRHSSIGKFSIARDKPCLVSSVSRFSLNQDRFIEAMGGNDGIVNGHCRFHTEFERDPWWQVDLLQIQKIKYVDIYNRLDQKSRCRRLAILVSDDGAQWRLADTKMDDTEFGGADGTPHIFKFNPPIETKFVRVQMIGDGFLHLDQIEIFGDCPERDNFQFSNK